MTNIIKTPSERISEILAGICDEKGCAIDSKLVSDYGYQEQAIIIYLDEEYLNKTK